MTHQREVGKEASSAKNRQKEWGQLERAGFRQMVLLIFNVKEKKALNEKILFALDNYYRFAPLFMKNMLIKGEHTQSVNVLTTYISF